MQECSFDLTRIGATAGLRAEVEAYAERGCELGRVSAVHREQYRIYTAAGERKAEAIGALLYRAAGAADLPAVGDWVAAQPTSPGEAMIHAVLPRRTKFSRRAAGPRAEEQMIAANIDVALIVCGLDHDFNPRRIERYLTLARESGAESAVILNKADLCDDPGAGVAQVVRLAGGAPVVAICARSPESAGVVLELIGKGGTAALLGSSGAGKSTLVNQLLGEQRQRVQEIRESDGRGRHTTTFRELLPLPAGGALIDTPGMRELALWAGPESLDASFSDIAGIAEGCRFRDCAHGVEHGCAVQAAILSGALEPGRWSSYQKLQAEIDYQDRKTNPAAALALKQRWKKIHKAMRKRLQ